MATAFKLEETAVNLLALCHPRKSVYGAMLMYQMEAIDRSCVPHSATSTKLKELQKMIGTSPFCCVQIARRSFPMPEREGREDHWRFIQILKSDRTSATSQVEDV
ncbi:hypothetical protein R1flu_019269 [Riccia fluitans]|uniref:Uncharacterized protein n=1 Tax=Riccia fluitans TaxID=41844 RepID=A0ABD1ZKD7_9MARC